MIKTIIRALYSAFISIILILILLAAWTGYAFISQTSKSNEIIDVIQDIYSNEKSVVIDVIDLSKILIKDTGKSQIIENNDLLSETDSLKYLDDNSKLDQLSINEDDGANPLGIVIEPSLPATKQENLPEISEEPIAYQENSISFNELGMDMD
tara:strand:+ start:847 stop:1305 length:459 start_codon:yes stop_codon:yes gene_type:complete